MFDSPILIYSNHCAYSKEFLETLGETPMAKMFMLLCIDVEPETKRRPSVFFDVQKRLNFKITEVPTIVVENGQYVLSGDEAFKWLNHSVKSMNKNNGLSGFNPNEMGSFSDQYSPYGSSKDTDASEQSFRFIDRQYDNIDTPPEGSIQKIDYEKKQKERENVAFISGNKPMQANVSQSISFNSMLGNTGNSNNMHVSGNYNNNNKGGVSVKKQDIDNRLEQLIAMRDELTPAKMQPKNIDFSSNFK